MTLYTRGQKGFALVYMVCFMNACVTRGNAPAGIVAKNAKKLYSFSVEVVVDVYVR